MFREHLRFPLFSIRSDQKIKLKNMNNDLTAFEKIPVKIFNTSEAGSIYVAKEIANLIKLRQKEGKPCVLGLATGSTPTRLYAELVKMHQKEGLSFKNVHTFNLDEYYPMQPEALKSRPVYARASF